MRHETEHPEGGVRIATSDDDRPEFERIRNGIIKALQKFAGYEPEIDDILVDQIASSTIYWKKLEKFLDAETASEYTFARVADSKSKFLAMIDTNLRELALNRRARIGQQGEAELMRKLREEIMKRTKR
ncbi:MAG TPA: hypothetical protein VEC43_05870 [Candidatus Acidoferrales bacterium]|nr:hypothetical protein [Candidatus Acidoferrales bacterium]